jgi:hypothetical protein
MAGGIRIKGLKTFSKDLSNFGKKVVPEDQKRLQQKIALDLLRRIIFKTPVDTGRARGNWQTTLGAPDNSEVENPGVGQALGEGAATIASLLPFGVITIYNNVKYIVFLENGSSQQAPSGMVKVSVAETNAQFR